MPMQTPEARVKRLEERFETIWHERMSNVPVINDRLKVEAVGFCNWNGHILGMLVTPWFMNLILLPGESDDWRGLDIGAKHSFKFTAGSFDFIVGDEPGIGKFMSCSMFSPMFKFENHETAVATAELIMKGLFEQVNQDVPQSQSLKVGEADGDNETSIPEKILEGMLVIAEATQKNMDSPMSRREFVHASFLRPRKNTQNQSDG